MAQQFIRPAEFALAFVFAFVFAFAFAFAFAPTKVAFATQRNRKAQRSDEIPFAFGRFRVVSSASRADY